MEIHATSCLAETTVLQLLEGSLSADAAASAEAHVARCRECRELVSALARSSGGAPAGPVEDEAYAEGMVLHGRFRLARRLGEGGMGTVWAATHLVTRKEVALKIARGLGSERDRHRFLREARVASALEHPGIVPVRDAFELEDGTPVLMMDLLVGRSLREHLREHAPLSVDEAERWARALIDALGAAHEQGVVHRDLKPENVFLVDEGAERRLKVLDFGVAKLITADEVSGQTTRSGEILGTPFYMAPEQAFGEKVDRRADLWALGVVLYECLTGERPFHGENLGQLLKAVTTGEHRPLAEARPQLPRALCAVVEALLTVDRERRPGTAADVLAALDGDRRLPRQRRGYWIAATLAAIGAAVAAACAWHYTHLPSAVVETTPPAPVRAHVELPVPSPPQPAPTLPAAGIAPHFESHRSHRAAETKEGKNEGRPDDNSWKDVRLPGGVVGTAPY
jgi:serine/threonine-protein kinase